MTLKHKGFKAWISFGDGGGTLEDYMACQDPVDEKVYTCWIASEAGKWFTVHWDSLEKIDSKGVVFMDGVETDRRAVSKNKVGTSKGVRTATRDIRPYIFSTVNITDDDSYLGVKQSTNTDELGSITLEIYLGSFARDNRKHHYKPREAMLYDGPVHESLKKICSHRVTLGETIPSGSGPSRKGGKSRWAYNDRNSPHVIFRFKYGPREFLRAQGIISTPVAIGGTSQIPISDNHDNAAGEENMPARKRSLTGPLEMRERSQMPCIEVNSQPVFFETPRRLKQDEDITILGYTQRGRKRRVKKDRNSESSQVKRLKQEPMDSVKAENGMHLWMDGSGVIDLTMDD